MLNGTKRKQQHPHCGKLYTSHNPVFQQPRDKLQRKTVRDTHTHTHRVKKRQAESFRLRETSWTCPSCGLPISGDGSSILPVLGEKPPSSVSSCTLSVMSTCSTFSHYSELGTPHPAPTTAGVQAWAPHLHIPQWPLTGPLFPTLSLHVYLQQTALLISSTSQLLTAASPYTVSGLIHKVHFLE